MLTSNITLIKQARSKLHNQWAVAIGATIIQVVISILIGGESLGVRLLALLLSGPLAYGGTAFYLNLVRGKTSISVYFSGFHDFKKYVILYAYHVIAILKKLILLIIPGIVACYSYVLTYYVSVDNPAFSPQETLQKSKDLMEGNRLKLFYLSLLLSVYIILGSVLMAIGVILLTVISKNGFLAFLAFIPLLLFIVPLIRTTTTLFYLDLVKNAKK